MPSMKLHPGGGHPAGPSRSCGSFRFPARGDAPSLRAMTDAWLDQAFLALPAPSVSSQRFEATAGDGTKIELRWYLHKDTVCGRYLHGGGVICGSLDSYDSLVRLRRTDKVPFLAIDYRLAPEHPGSIPQDAMAGLEWLFDNAAELGRVPQRARTSRPGRRKRLVQGLSRGTPGRGGSRRPGTGPSSVQRSGGPVSRSCPRTRRSRRPHGGTRRQGQVSDPSGSTSGSRSERRLAIRFKRMGRHRRGRQRYEGLVQPCVSHGAQVEHVASLRRDEVGCGFCLGQSEWR